MLFKIAIVSEIGRRKEMEDRYYLDKNFQGKGWLFGGVYDGHGGSFAAEYAADNLHKVFLEKLEADIDEEEAFIKTYEKISQEVSHQDSGTTAANFFLRNKKIFWANVGDVRIIILRKTSGLQLTRDHRLSDDEEKKRILREGGIIKEPYIVLGGQGLMPTRSMGDEKFKSVGVIATPSVGQYDIQPEDKWLIIASDGLFDEMKNEDISLCVKHCEKTSEVADLLKQEVLEEQRGEDNLTIIVVKLKAH